MELIWHPYRYYPYEEELARREIKALLPKVKLSDTNKGIKLRGNVDIEVADRLVYFSRAMNGNIDAPTMQAKLERVNGNGLNRQSTRYSAHGLHEYKGKFNPQIARAILNILEVPIGAKVIDPFCGSGTSLLECAHLGMRAVGTDLNPLAVFIANAKLKAIRIPAEDIRRELSAVIQRQKSIRIPKKIDPRTEYMLSWFDKDIFNAIEKLRLAIAEGNDRCSAILLTIASNLLRDYSKQDPNDLRIRRRKSPLPEKPFVEAFEEEAQQFLAKLEDAQKILGKLPQHSKALLLDSRALKLSRRNIGIEKFDCALTSPPYATALPYIDTQRLSLVWLGMITPSEILKLESDLVGSREIRGESKKCLEKCLLENGSHLPETQVNYCRQLQKALSEQDGFRRQAVPALLYRYFAEMAQVFRALRPCMKDNAPFALIVGGNHTVLSGQRFDINTPQHLAEIAAASGWKHTETVPLQTYQRYGYHMNNAVNNEALVIVRAA